MGNTKSTIDVDKELVNEVLSSISQKGKNMNVVQQNTLNDSTIILDGSNCPNGMTFTIENTNNITDDLIFSSVAEATAKVLNDIATEMNVEHSSFNLNNTNTTMSEASKVANTIKTQIESDCGNSTVNQSNTLNNVLINAKCVSNFSIKNDNDAKLACAVDSAAKTTADLQTTMETKASESTSSLNGSLIWIAIIAVAVVIIFVVISSNSTAIIIILIILLIIGVLGVILFSSQNDE